MTNKPQKRVEYSDRFKKDIKRLNKRFRRLRKDVDSLISQLEVGETPGNKVQGVKRDVYKVRLKSSDLQKGKSGGFRVIYYLQTADAVLLVTMYVKSEQEDISLDEIRRIIESFEQEE